MKIIISWFSSDTVLYGIPYAIHGGTLSPLWLGLIIIIICTILIWYKIYLSNNPMTISRHPTVPTYVPSITSTRLVSSRHCSPSPQFPCITLGKVLYRVLVGTSPGGDSLPLSVRGSGTQQLWACTWFVSVSSNRNESSKIGLRLLRNTLPTVILHTGNK